MVQINIPAKIEIPDYIEVRLVRDDLQGASNIFRIAFESFLAIFSSIIGALFTIKSFAPLHWFLFWFFLSGAIIFLILSLVYSKKAKLRNVNSNTLLDKFPINIKGYLLNVKLSDIKTVEDILSANLIPKESIYWHSNKYKTQYKTLKITNLTNEKIVVLLDQFKNQGISFADEKFLV